MALDFSRYYSKGRATTDQPSFLAPESTEGQRLQEAAKVGQVAQEISGKLLKAYDDSQKSTSELNQREQTQDLLLRAEQDPDYNSFQKYADENKKILIESTQSFKDKPSDREASAKARFFKGTTDRELQRIFNKKMIEHERGNTLRFLDLEVNNPIPGADTRIKSRITAQKEKGFINESEAYELEKEYLDKLKMSSFVADLTDIEDARQRLNENVYDFTDEQKEKAETVLDRTEKRQKEETQRTQFNSAVDAGTALVNGTLTQNNIREMVMTGTMDPELAGAFEIALYSPSGDSKKYFKKNQPSLAGAYIGKAIKDMKEFDEASALKLVKGAVEEYASTKPALNEKDLSFIFKAIDERRKNPDNPIWDQLKQSVTMLPQALSGSVFAKFMTRWNFSDDPRSVMQGAVDDTIKDSDPRAVKFVVGQRYKYGVFLGFNPETGKARFEK